LRSSAEVEGKKIKPSNMRRALKSKVGALISELPMEMLIELDIAVDCFPRAELSHKYIQAHRSN
jgi:hypothetical protein